LLDDYSYDGDKVEDDDDDDDDDAYVCDNEVNKQIYDCLQQYVKHHINTAVSADSHFYLNLSLSFVSVACI